ncbi:MAG TPA: hypothetical protein VGU63_12510 [Candidatus Acidoferrales bacterium]|nr:hypothetical protein [Candidatus Acidoferrales bacterium]
MTSSGQLADTFGRCQKRALIAGLVALAICIIGAIFSPEQFFRSYLFAYVFWIGFPLGGMAVVMLHHLTGGQWGLPIRRILEAASRTLPLMAVLFLPILLGLPILYRWAQPTTVALDPILKYKHPYMNDWTFIARTIFYFAVWILWASLLNRWSAEQDRTGDSRLAKRLESFSGPGLVVYGLTLTFACVDWVMSLEPKWYSTIYGLLFMVVEALVAFAFAIWISRWLARYEPLSSYVSPQQFHDLGNLVLTFVMLWAYLAFSQFLIIWTGNLKEEIPWFESRARGVWAGLAIFLIVFHFFVPFLLLLSRDVKRRAQMLAKVSIGLLFVSLIDVYWLIVPAFEPAGPRIHLLDFAAPVAIGGIWLAAFFHQLKDRPLIPLHDPNFAEVYAHGD